MKMKIWIAAFLACFSTACLAADFSKTLKFVTGASSATVEGSVVRGDRDVYIVYARAGQQISISASALEKNVAFSVFAPGSTEPLAGTEEENDISEWSGTLPANGGYRIRIGGTRGNATYKLKVAIK